MTESQMPSGSSHPLAELMADAARALPAAYNKTAIAAVSRLVTGVVDWPVAWLREQTEKIENRAYERRVISRSVADAAAKVVTADADQIDRSVTRALNKAVRIQQNLEGVAIAALEDLSKPGVSPEPEETESEGSKSEPEDEWFFQFERYAEAATTERLRNLWGRVLSGEIRKPGSFSIAALRILSEINAENANNFAEVLKLSFGNIIPRDFIGSQGSIFSKCRLLEDAGLISNLQGNLSKNLQLDGKPQTAALSALGHALVVAMASPREIQIPVVFLTAAGRELSRLVDLHDERSVAIRMLPMMNLQEGDAVMLWKLTPKHEVIPSSMELLFPTSPS